MKAKFINSFAALLVIILLGVGAPLALYGQDQTDQPSADQPQDQPADNQPAQQPASTVGRVSFIHGEVSHLRGDTGEWSAASLNAPVVAGDSVSTGDKSRTEVELDYGDILRLDERTQANITNLTRTQIQIQLSQGEANYTVYKNSEADAEIDTPNVALHPNHNGGSYRIEVISDQETRVIARKGGADISTPQGSTHLDSGEMITIRGAGNDTQYKIADAPDKDNWDRWNNDRDHLIQTAHSWSNTDRYYVGSEDLDAYGKWRNIPDYGPVWVPAAAPGWVPYSAGQWVWEPDWGWTWVSSEPWGWAPYHYGRWMYYDDAWMWWPGPVGGGFYQPVWAPAYVSFFGFGGGGWGFGVGFGWGSIGWLPLGPCDRFYPWWGGYRSQFNVVNITNVTNIYNVRGAMPPLRTGTQFSNVYQAMHNENFRRAISTVPANNFGRGRITPRPVTREQFANPRLVAGNLPVVPNRQSLSVSGRPASPSTLVHATQPAHFFSNARPSAGARPSFTQERTQLQNAIQRSGQPVISARDNGGPVNSRPGMNNAASNGRPGQNIGRTPSAGPVNNTATRGSSPTNTRGSAETVTVHPSTPTRGWQTFGAPRPNTNNSAGGFHGSQPNSGQSGREVTNGNAGRSGSFGSQPARPQSNSGWHTFSGQSSGPGARPENPGSTMNRGSASVSRPQGTLQAQNRTPDGWQKFTPRPSSSNNAGPSRGSAPSGGNRNSGSVWSERPPTPSRSAGPSGGYSRSSSGRPPLDMRQPIVTPRYSNPRYSAPSSPRYSAPPSPRYSPPSSPRYSQPAPRSYSPPSGGGYRGGPPSGGYSGGGFHGAPSGGGYHGGAPSGGGYHGGGGGSSHGGGGNSHPGRR